MPVFRCPGRLRFDYVPGRLPHREKHLEKLLQMFRMFPGGGLRVHVTGETGTGKTVLCRVFGEKFQVEAEKSGFKVKYVHVNLAQTPKPYHVAFRILSALSPSNVKTGLSCEEMLTVVGEVLRREKLSLILCLDEADTYISEGRDEKIFYLLSRFHEFSASPGEEWPQLSLIYVSRSIDWIRRLSRHVVDTVGRVQRINLESYRLNQLKDILAYRVEEAFKPGAVPEDVVEFTADLAQLYGGVRYGLELLLAAGYLAENEYTDTVKPEHVRKAHSQIPKGLNGPIHLSELSLHKQLLLYSLASLAKRSVSPYLSFEEILEEYRFTCGRYSVEPEEKKNVKTHLKELSMQGYLMAKRRGGEDIYSLEFPAENIVKALRENLKSWMGGEGSPRTWNVL